MEVGRVDGITGATGLAATSPLSPQDRIEQQWMIHAVEAVNQAGLFGESNEVTFGYDRNGRRLVLRLVDRETKEVVRQLPPEYLLRLAEGLGEEARLREK